MEVIRILRLLGLGAALWVGVAAAPVGDSHWAFQPIGDPALPAAAGPGQPSGSPVDAFIRARLDAAGRSPAPAADRRTLLRRLSFDLRGLPPTAAEVEAFAADPDPDAFARWVDRYLESPQYGERWGRWWLDLARYADTNGQDENKVMANAWRYRDWVIRSFNANQPLDDFITDQIAGDLRPTNGVPESVLLDRWIATGFLVLGPKMLAEQDKPKLVMDLVDEQLDVVGRAFLGLTVSCARCHDHKYDPISARDYYALAGIFKSTRAMENLDFVSKFNERPVSTREHLEAVETHARAVASAGNAWTNALNAATASLRRQWRTELATALEAPPPWERPADTPMLERLAQWRSADPDVNPAVPLLRALADRQDGIGIAAEIEALEADSAAASGLRLGPGRVGRGFQAAGQNFLERPHQPELEPLQLTVESWVRVSAFPKEGDARRWLVSKNPNEWEEGHYALVLDRDRPGAYLNIGGGREHMAAVWSEPVKLEANRWHHLAFTYDGQTLRLFVDGVAAGETPVGRARVPGTHPLMIARRPDGYVTFRGQLDGIRIYRQALSPEAVAASARHPEAAPGDGWVAAWDFDELTESERLAADRAALRDALLGAGGILEIPADPRAWLTVADREELDRLAADWDRVKAAAPPPPAYALAVAEDKPVDLPVFNRGNHLSPGPEPVPRGFLKVAYRPSDPLPPAGASGRLELAQWLTSPNQPLTARVLANRVWQAHFGEGLVRTSDNFGVRGEPPSHPELLDWLARQLMESGWNLKRLHRILLNSATWQQASSGSDEPGGAAPDPDNRLLSRFPRQRLEAEMVRDALLAVSERLDPAMGGRLVSWKNDEYAPADDVSAASVRRSVYLPVVRDRVFDVFTLFDFANPSVGTAKRAPTVVAHQALFFMNSPLVRDSARALAASLADGCEDEGVRLERVYRRLYGRPPADSERARARRFLDSASPAAGGDRAACWSAMCQSLMSANEFLYLE